MSSLTKKKQYIQDMGLMMEGFGLPQMAGRVFGALLVADPPEVTADELSELLEASRGGVSGAVTMLEAMGLIERTRKPGDRKDYFRNKPNAWFEAVKKEIMLMSQFRLLAERGLDIVNTNDPDVTQGLRDMRDMITFFERELPEMFERWQRERVEEVEA